MMVNEMRKKEIVRIKERFALCEKCIRLKKKSFPRDIREQAIKKAQKWSMKSRGKWSNPILITDTYIEKNKDFYKYIMEICEGCPYKQEHNVLKEYKNFNICKSCKKYSYKTLSYWDDQERHSCDFHGGFLAKVDFIRIGISDECPYKLEHIVSTQDDFETELNL